MQNYETFSSELDDIMVSLNITKGILQTLTRSQLYILGEYSVGDVDFCNMAEDRMGKDIDALGKIFTGLREIKEYQYYSILPESLEIFKGEAYSSLKELQSKKGNTLIEVQEASLLLGLPYNQIIDKLRAQKISGELLPIAGAEKLRWYVSLNLLENKYQITYWKSKGVLK